MKRIDLIRHMEKHGAQFLREGGNHSVYVNRKNGKVSTIPRHREINEFLPRKFAETSRYRSRNEHCEVLDLLSPQRGDFEECDSLPGRDVLARTSP
jgi:mRNA interferase HicA